MLRVHCSETAKPNTLKPSVGKLVPISVTILFSVLTLLIGQQEGHAAAKNLAPKYRKNWSVKQKSNVVAAVAAAAKL